MNEIIDVWDGIILLAIIISVASITYFIRHK